MNTIKGLSSEEQAAFQIIAKRLAKEEMEANPAPISEKEKKIMKKKQLEAQQEYFQKFDEEVGALPEAFQQIRDALAVATGWQEGDGLCQLHFSKKPLGSQCLWAANWQTSRGILSPGSFYPLERMTSTELLVEGKDAINPGLRFAGIRRPDPNIIKKEIVPVMETYEAGGINFLDDLKKGLTRIRGAYSEFIFPFDVPAQSFIVLVRPGWGTRKEIVNAMEQLRSDLLPRR